MKKKDYSSKSFLESRKASIKSAFINFIETTDAAHLDKARVFSRAYEYHELEDQITQMIRTQPREKWPEICGRILKEDF
jgi:hypothetical protein